MGTMPEKQTDKKREGTSKDHDFTIKARNVLEQAIGEHLDVTLPVTRMRSTFLRASSSATT